MDNPFTYQFFIEAFVAIVLLSLILPFIGNRLASRGMSMLADTISHTALAGVAVGLACSSFPIVYSILFSIVACLLMYFIQRLFPQISEIFLAMVLSFSLALAGIMTKWIPGNRLDSYLFGSLFTITKEQLITLIVVAGVAILYEILMYPFLARMDFDGKAYQARHHHAPLIGYLDTLVTATVIAVASNITGVLLIAGFVSIPVFLGYQASHSLRGSILLSMLVSLVSGIVGLLISYYASLHVGGTIIMTAIALNLIFLPISVVVKRHKQR